MILLLGGTGYVGSAFREHFERNGIEHTSVSRKQHDYSSAKVLRQIVDELQPSFLINAAGYTGKPNVDACEIQKVECLAGNTVLPGTIRDVCQQADVPWGHVSSGCIYTGRRADGAGFTESDSPNFSFRTNNCSWYSGCKALGEEVLLEAPQTFLWRLRIPFDNHESPRNYLTKLIRYDRLLEAENSISHLGEFVAACTQCWLKRVPFGIYNVTNTGFVTTKRVTELIQQYLLPSKRYDFFADESEFMQLAAKTPRSNCVMDNSKLLNAGIQIRDVETAIIDSLQSWEPEENVAHVRR